MNFSFKFSLELIANFFFFLLSESVNRHYADYSERVPVYFDASLTVLTNLVKKRKCSIVPLTLLSFFLFDFICELYIFIYT